MEENKCKYADEICNHTLALILMLYPNEFKLAEQGFITSECKFVDRKEALKIAKEYKQINNKIVNNNELYSEDLFLVKELEKNRYVDKLE